jgi:hypothetical protein
MNWIADVQLDLRKMGVKQMKNKSFGLKRRDVQREAKLKGL